MMVYFILANSCCSEAYEEYHDALDQLRHLDETNPDLGARLVAVDEYEAGQYLRMPRLRTSE